MIDGIDPEAFGPIYLGPGDQDRSEAIAAIRKVDRRWRVPSQALSLGKLRWRPDLETAKRRVLLLALTGEIPEALLRRLRAATKHGYDVTVAVGPPPVDTQTLLALQAVDARIVAVDWVDERCEADVYRSVADWIATRRIALAPVDLQQLARARFEEALVETRNVKGRFYEEVLCLVFSQVPWLTVDEHGYRNASEEIDIVLGVHAAGHVAELVGGGVAVATCKNRTRSTDSETVKYLKEQVANRKRRCQLGFLCSATTISADARTEILRGSQGSDLVIAEIDGDDLKAVLERPEQLDDQVQGLIRRAIAS